MDRRLTMPVNDDVAFSCQSAITYRTVRSLVFALREMVAAHGRYPVPSSRMQASASANQYRVPFD